MKTLELANASGKLSDYAKAMGDEIVVLMSNNEPVAAIVSLKNIDWELISLSTNPEFLKIIQNARNEFRKGEKLSFEEMKREFQTADQE
jgi:hypothetical protein